MKAWELRCYELGISYCKSYSMRRKAKESERVRVIVRGIVQEVLDEWIERLIKYVMEEACKKEDGSTFITAVRLACDLIRPEYIRPPSPSPSPPYGPRRSPYDCSHITPPLQYDDEYFSYEEDYFMEDAAKEQYVLSMSTFGEEEKKKLREQRLVPPPSAEELEKMDRKEIKPSQCVQESIARLLRRSLSVLLLPHAKQHWVKTWWSVEENLMRVDVEYEKYHEYELVDGFVSVELPNFSRSFLSSWPLYSLLLAIAFTPQVGTLIAKSVIARAFELNEVSEDVRERARGGFVAAGVGEESVRHLFSMLQL